MVLREDLRALHQLWRLMHSEKKYLNTSLLSEEMETLTHVSGSLRGVAASTMTRRSVRPQLGSPAVSNAPLAMSRIASVHQFGSNTPALSENEALTSSPGAPLVSYGASLTYTSSTNDALAAAAFATAESGHPYGGVQTSLGSSSSLLALPQQLTTPGIQPCVGLPFQPPGAQSGVIFGLADQNVYRSVGSMSAPTWPGAGTSASSMVSKRSSTGKLT
ncbi:unnamed protein product [Protopolystoma xenopodis]|uniref:Uncharacterized protein n=1 Tax=Protopolystoma xenopodis TaxID=117903 RepID=A0A448XID6_9PLAT|nr:unnamed protein product [Protopolystoma xenopodis]